MCRKMMPDGKGTARRAETDQPRSLRWSWFRTLLSSSSLSEFSSICFTAWITVPWERPPNARPISWCGFVVSLRDRYMAIMRGLAMFFGFFGLVGQDALRGLEVDLLFHGGGVHGEAHQRALQRTDVRGDAFGDEGQDVVAQLHAQALLFLLQDGEARLEGRLRDLGGHAGDEAGDEARLEAGDLGGLAVGREDDLLAEPVQGVERIEELFLQAGLVAERVDVVDEQIVDVAEGLAELVHGLGAQGIEERIEEVFAGRVADARLRVVDADLVRHGEQQMRLAHAGAAVDVQGIDLAGVLCGGERGRVGVAVFLADHEVVERVLADEAGELGADLVVVIGGFRAEAGRIGVLRRGFGVNGIVDVAGLEHDLHAGTPGGCERLGNEVAVVFHHDVCKEIIRGADHDPGFAVVNGDRHHLLEPLFVHCFGFRPDESDC